MLVKIKKLSEEAVIPKYSKRGDAGLDLTATNYKFEDGRHVYGTSLAIEIPEGFVGLVFPRSSVAKYDLRLSNAVGVIDSNYRGEIMFKFENHGMNVDYNPEKDISGVLWPRDTKLYNVGDRIGQLLIVPYPKIEFIETTHLSETNRGSGGFGSSGV